MRGCVGDLPLSNATECLNNSDICKTCQGNNCNTRIKFQECYDCNSQNDPKCAKDPKSTSITQLCKHYNSKCATGIDNGNTHRKCIPESVVSSNEFETCAGINCNDEIYPKNRLYCYQCDREADCDLNPSQRYFKPEPCEFYSNIDQCFTYAGPGKINFYFYLNRKILKVHFILKDKKISRGCSSDGKASRLKCEMVVSHKNGTCIKCNESGCNNQPKFSPAKLSCSECDDENECVFGQNSTKTAICKKQVALGDLETCFTQSVKGLIFITFSN